jgi:uncharacterized protein involved in outer membrane biogenesis
MRRKLLVAAIVLIGLAVGGVLIARAVLVSDLVRSTVEQQLATRLEMPVRIRSASAALFPRASLDLHDVSIGAPPAMEFSQIRVVTGLRGLISRVVTDAEVVISNGRIACPMPLSFTTAASRPSEPPSSPVFTVQSIHLIELRNVTLVGGSQSLAVDMDSSIDGDRLDINRLAARARTTRITASGALTSIAGLEGTLDARAEPLDLDEVIAIASALTSTAEAPTAPRRASDKPAPMHLVVKLGSPNGTFTTYTFTDLATTLDVKPQRLALARLSVRTFGGKFDGRLDVGTTAGPGPAMQLAGRADGLDVAALLKTSGAAGGITGRLGGTTSLHAVGSEAPVLIRSARGSMNALVTDGSIPGLDLVRTIVLAFGKPSGAPVEGSGSAFSRLGGDFVMAGGTLTTENLTMNSRDFDLSGHGSLQVMTGIVNARVDVVLSRDLTAQAGTDLRRYAQEDGRVIVPATITGTLEHPTVSLDVAAAMRRALENELQRRAKGFLQDLFRKKQDQ